MTPCEHSRLLFLFASLRAAPHKARRLLEMAGSGSPRYAQAVERLRKVSAEPGEMVLAEVARLRLTPPSG